MQGNARLFRKVIVSLAFSMALLVSSACTAEEPALNVPPNGFTRLFNGKDISGWKGLVADPIQRAGLKTQMRVTNASRVNQFRIVIDAQAERRPDRIKQVAQPATDLEHARAGPNMPLK